jgi:signal transduction histidine kinase
MIRIRSLTLRLVVYLVVTELLAFLSWPLVAMLLSAWHVEDGPANSLNYWASPHAFEVVTQSLVQAPNGSISLEPSPSMRAFIERNPNFRFVVFDQRSGVALPGSSADMVAMLGNLNRLDLFSTNFRIRGEPNANLVGMMEAYSSPIGKFNVALYGYSFHWDDVSGVFRNYFGPLLWLATQFPTIMASAIVVFIVVRIGHAPLRRSAAKLTGIDIHCLDQRLSIADVPMEVEPFIVAVNEMLARLSASVASQKAFLANAAHELCTPITILCARIDNGDEQTFRQEIKRDARRIRAIVEQLLVAARISNDETLIDHEIDLGKTILKVILDIMPFVIKSRRNLEFDDSPSPVSVRGNPHALESVIANLINNAIRAEPERGTIAVRVLPSAAIEVVDHGPGVALEHRQKIFERFWRGSEATPGTGLGLAIAKEIVELHGGTICVGETPGGGATFKVTLRQRQK